MEATPQSCLDLRQKDGLLYSSASRGLGGEVGGTDVNLQALLAFCACSPAVPGCKGPQGRVVLGAGPDHARSLRKGVQNQQKGSQGTCAHDNDPNCLIPKEN